MALIVCTECGKKFSDKAKCCPKCACPTEYVISATSNVETPWANRVVRKSIPIKVKYGRSRNEQIQKEAIGEKNRIVDRLNQIVDYVKHENPENIITNAMQTIDNMSKTLKEMNMETRKEFFAKCTLENQMLVEMRHAGWNKEIKAFNREWAMLYSGEANFNGRIKDASMNTPCNERVFSIRECDPNEYKWELFPKDRYNKIMEKIEIDFYRGEHIVISFVPAIKKEIYKIPNYGWNIELERLSSNFVINDANGRQFAKVYRKIANKSDIYVIDYFDDKLKQILLAITIAMDLCRSGYEPRTLREKLDL